MVPVRVKGCNTMDRLRPFATALAAATVALAVAWGIQGLGDTDPYRHMEYAHQLWLSGLRLRGHPFLPFTTLGDSGVDLWWGFHLLLIPFTALGTLWGARVAGATIAAVQAGSLAALLCRAGQRSGWLFALAPLVISSQFTFRDHLARPSHLTVPLLMVNLLAGTGLLSPALAAAASFAHGLIHLSSPLSPVFAALGLVGARVVKQGGSVRAAVWSSCGLAVALAVRPDRFEYLNVALLTNLGALGFFGGGHLPHTGFELNPIAPIQLLQQTWAGFALVAVAIGLGWGRPRCGSAATRVAAGLASAASLMMTLRSGRFLDYIVPFLVLSAGVLWPLEWKASRRTRAVLAGTVALAAATLLANNIRVGWKLGNAYIDPPRVFEEMAKQVRAHVAPGTLLFGDDLFLTGVLYAFLPEYKYVAAYDPSLLYFGNRRLFWIWHHVVVEGVDCDGVACPGAAPGPDEIAAAVHSFGTDWVITSYPQAIYSMQRVMLVSPQRFELIAHVPGPVTGLYLWHVKE
jgi:hypothetical protein